MPVLRRKNLFATSPAKALEYLSHILAGHSNALVPIPYKSGLNF
jgi:hypothetical protein